MTRYLCKTEEELNYIIDKLKLDYSNESLNDIIKNFKIKRYVTLNYNKINTNYCHYMCNECYIIGCETRATEMKNVSNLMREEKLNRILND